MADGAVLPQEWSDVLPIGRLRTTNRRVHHETHEKENKCLERSSHIRRSLEFSILYIRVFRVIRGRLMVEQELPRVEQSPQQVLRDLLRRGVLEPRLGLRQFVRPRRTGE